MTRRMACLMLCALALGLLLALDGPQSGPLVEASAGPERTQRPESDLVASVVPAQTARGGQEAHGVAQVEQAAQVAPAAQKRQAAHEAAPAALLDDAVVDLFAGAGDSASSAAPSSSSATGEERRAAVPVTLLGFKEENGTRDAYLLHDGAVHMVRAGAVLVQRYRVLALEQDAVRLQDQQTGEKIRIVFGDIE